MFGEAEKDCQTKKYFISLGNNYVIWEEKLFQNYSSSC